MKKFHYNSIKLYSQLEEETGQVVQYKFSGERGNHQKVTNLRDQTKTYRTAKRLILVACNGCFLPVGYWVPLSRKHSTGHYI